MTFTNVQKNRQIECKKSNKAQLKTIKLIICTRLKKNKKNQIKKNN